MQNQPLKCVECDNEIGVEECVCYCCGRSVEDEPDSLLASYGPGDEIPNSK